MVGKGLADLLGNVKRDTDTKYVYTEDFEKDLQRAKNLAMTPDTFKGSFYEGEFFKKLDLGKTSGGYETMIFRQLESEGLVISAGADCINGYYTFHTHKRVVEARNKLHGGDMLCGVN